MVTIRTSKWIAPFCLAAVLPLPLAADSPIEEMIADQRARRSPAAPAALANGVGIVCPPGTGAAEFHLADFEVDDGGWVESGFGDWERGGVTTGVWELCDAAPRPEPAGVFNGAAVMGTNLDGCYQNSGQDSSLSQTFDFSTLAAPIALEWAHWYEVFMTFDRADVFVEGVSEYFVPDSTPTADWLPQVVDLSAYAGMPAIDIEFRLHATTVVNRMGWYLDDVRILYCTADIFADGFETGDTTRWSNSLP